MIIRKICYSLLLLAVFSSCKKEEPAEIDLGYDFFPNEVRSFIVYRVDSIHYGINQEEFTFQIKEVLANEFIDGEGKAAMSVERYKRQTNADPWVLQNVWVQKRTPTAAERVEDNIRYVRLAFPVEDGKSWNGNAYNTLGEWEYEYADVDEPFELGINSFSKSLRVNQRNNVNLVDQEIAYEVYARGVGLVQKYFKDVSIQPGQMSGVEYTWSVLLYGTEP
jgi:hypothetical protein